MSGASSGTGSSGESPARGSTRLERRAVLSVCVLVVGASSPVDQCLDALAAPGARPEASEVVVVANGAPEPVVDRLRGRRDVVVVESAVNLGFAGGCNLAATVATGELLVFLNDDSVVEPGCLAALVAAVRGDPGLAAVGPRVLSPDGTVQEAGSVLWRDGSTAHVAVGSPDRPDVAGEARDVDAISANGLLVTRSAFEAVGGFDEDFYPAYYEDVDLCLALAERGYRIGYEPRARLVHAGSASSTEPFRRFLLERNRDLLCARWGAALERFPPRPRPDRGRSLDRAVTQAVGGAAGRGRGRAHGEEHAGAPAESTRRGGAPVADRGVQAQRAGERLDDLEAQYLAFLERRWVEDADRLAALQTYVATRPVLQVKRALARLVGRR